MEWGASRILALRKHAGMTQAQFSRWLGVTIKQVKYLEHQRRNPSGPTRRLLGILADQLAFDGATPVQVLGASPAELNLPRRDVSRMSASDKVDDDQNSATTEAAPPAAEMIATTVETALPVPDDDAFVWR